MTSPIDDERLIEQIRLGLRLVAEELPAPAAASQMRRRPQRRLVVAALGLAAAAAVAGVLAVVRGGGGGPTAAPRFLPDSFDYRVDPDLTAGGLFGGSQPSPPYFVPNLSDVAAASARSAWAVGSPVKGKSVVWHWDGVSWQSVPVPTVSGRLYLTSVAAVGDDDAWAVGRQSRQIDRLNYDRHAVIEHWDGARWRMVPVPYAGQSSLFSVAASGPDDVWAVGESYHDTHATFKDFAQGKFPAHHDRLLLLHWDGKSWSTVRLPWARSGLVGGATVTATGPTDVWVVSEGTEESATASDGKQVTKLFPGQVEHWNGRRWQAVPAPFGPKDPGFAFSATSADDAWAVGSYRRAGRSRTLAAHWDGRSWQIAPTPNRNVDSVLSAVVAVRPDDVWAAGESQWRKHVIGEGTRLKEPIALFEHWDGRRWQIMPGKKPVVAGGLAISATREGTAWAVGTCFYDNVILRWSGSEWQISSHPPDKYPPHAPGYKLTCSSPTVAAG